MVFHIPKSSLFKKKHLAYVTLLIKFEYDILADNRKEEVNLWSMEDKIF